MRALGATGEPIPLKGEIAASDEADGYLKGRGGEGQSTGHSVMSFPAAEIMTVLWTLLQP